MARTWKDRPSKIKYPEFYTDYDDIWYTFPALRYHRLERKGVRTKKPKHKDTNWHWLQSTPSWWTRMTMNRPKRRACRIWEHEIKYLEDLSGTDCPDWGHKPHHYYW